MTRAPFLAALSLAVLGASSTARAEEPARTPPPTREPGPVESELSIKLSLGGDYRDIVGVPIFAGDLELSVGVRMGVYAVYGTAGATAGKTEEGLGTTVYALGCSFERRLDRFALGAGFRPSYLRINRITSGSAMDSLGIGVAPFVAFDIASWEEHVLFVSAKINADEYVTGESLFAWGPTLSIGYREQ